MRVNFGLEGTSPDAEDLNWQERYVDGTASLDEMLHYARTFAKACQDREKAWNYARASCFLSGLKPTDAAEAHARRFIRGEMSLTEFVQQMPKS